MSLPPICNTLFSKTDPPLDTFTTQSPFALVPRNIPKSRANRKLLSVTGPMLGFTCEKSK